MNEYMTDDEFSAAVAALDDLAIEEYGVDLDALFEDDDPWTGRAHEQFYDRPPQADAFWRAGRLTGIGAKMPFAYAEPVQQGFTGQTGAKRRWEIDHTKLSKLSTTDENYQFLAGFLEAEAKQFDWMMNPTSIGPEEVSLYLIESNSERGVFRTMLTRIRPYICSDPEVKEAVEAASTISKPSILDSAVNQAGNHIATLLIAKVSWLAALGSVGPLVIAGIVVLLIKLGADEVCRRTLPPGITAEVET